ncbi:neuraminidase-like domain-containing protein [Actinoplanes sp. NPDC024001]|uniref:neuraminidase-like domain-containing protein n=1 Tax=Actinoplanes sp. NPDC024001 TaxID=3154598 RepID=UPI0033DDCB71
MDPTRPDQTPAAIAGKVHLEYGGPAADRTLRAYRKGFGGVTTRIGETSTGGDGSYRLELPPQGPLNLELRMVQAGGAEVTLTDTLFGVRPGDVINVVAPTAVQPPPTEHGRLLTDTKRHLAGQPLGAARQTADQPDLTLLQENTGWDARLVALAATADHVAADTGLDPAAAYALVRAGLPGDPAGLAGVAPQAVDRALTATATAGIVDLDEPARRQAVAAFTGFARAHRLAATAPGALSSQRDMLAAADLTDNQAAAFDDIEATIAHTGGAPDDLWTAAAEADLPVDTLKLVGRLGRLTLNNAPLTRRLLRTLKSNHLGPALVSLNLHQPRAWERAVRAAADSAEVAVGDLVPPAFPGLAAYAADMARKVRISFPTNVVASAVATGRLTLADVDDTVRHHTATVLDRAAALDLQLGRTPVSAMLHEHGTALLDGIPAGQRDAVTATIRTLHRVYQISPTDEAMAALLDADLRSAHDVTAMPLRTFLARHGERFASAAEATRTYAKAQQVAGAALTTVTAARQLAAAPPVFALSGTGAAAHRAGQDRLVETFPTMEQLFGSQDFCTCDHCRSVLGPAAYLVDLLHFLDPPAGTLPSGAKAPFEVLDARRPDLAELPLTCENTNTVLPYIDLVNEICEYYVAHGRLTTGAVRDTGDALSADLVAEPQFLIPQAYDELRRAVHPMTLPFDLWLETVRRLLDHFGTPLWQVLETFRRSDELYPRGRHRYGLAAVAIERLGLSPAEHDLLTAADQQAHWHELYGYRPADEAKALAELPNAVTLARRLGVSYRDLLLLVTSRFVNPELAAVTALPKFGLALSDLLRYRGAAGHAPMTEDERAAFEAALEPAGGPAALDAVLAPAHLARMLVLADPSGSVGFETTVLQYADGRPADPIAFLLLDHLVRVWRRTGWTLAETDRALTAFLPTDPDPRTGATIGPALASALLGAARLGALTETLPGDRTELLELWTDLTPQRYAALFLVPGTPPVDPAVFDQPLGRYLEHLDGSAWRPFRWRPEVPEDPATGNVSLATHAGTVQGALGLAATDLTAILADAGTSLEAAPLSLATVSLLHRYAVLARRLKLTVPDLIALRQLAGVDPFTPPPPGPVTVIADDHAAVTVTFAETVTAVRSAGLAVADLDYLLRHRYDPAGPFAPVAAPPLELIRALAVEIDRIGAEHADPADPSALGDDELRQKMALVLPADTVDTFFGMWTATITYDAVLTQIAEGDALDPALVADQPSISLRYDPVRGEQHLLRTGVLLRAEKERLLRAFGGTADELARYRELLDSVQATAQGFFDAVLLAPVGFLAAADFATLFAPAPVRDDAAARQLLLGAFLPFLRDRLIDNAIVAGVLGVFTAEFADSEALVTAILDGPALTAYRAAGDRGVTVAADAAAQTASVEAYLEVPTAGTYRFAVACERAGTTVELRFDHLPDAVLLSTTTQDGQQPGTAVELLPGITYHLVVTATGTSGGAVEVRVLGENLPEGPLDRLICRPAEAVERVRRAHVRLDKALRLCAAAGLTEPELRHLLTHPDDFGGLDLAAFPVTAAEDRPRLATALFGQVRRLLDLAALRTAIGALPGELTDLFAHARQTYAADLAPETATETLLADVRSRVAVLTRREETVIAEAFDRLGIGAVATGTGAAVPALTSEIGLGRLWTVLALATRIGISPAALADSAVPEPDAAVARRLRDAVRAGYDADGWRRVAQPIFDTLRQRRRDALVAWIMQHEGLTLPDQLYEFFLIDPATEPVVHTSRLRLAISAVQLFVQRCLLNLEPDVPASLIDAERWQWMKRYRLWEANRKIFLWPENWLEPEFRDDKSHLFDGLESTLLAGDVTEELVEEALFAYLRGLEPLARLDIRSIHRDPSDDTVHVVGRTFAAPYAYFYRTYRHGMWTPWVPVTTQIDGDHLVAAMWRDRLHLFWVTFVEHSDASTPSGSIEDLAESSADELRATRIVDVQLHWTEYHQDTWTEPTSGGLSTPVSTEVGPNWSAADQSVHVSASGDALLIHLNCQFIDSINLSFLLENKNSPPLRGAHEKPPVPPYTTWSVKIEGTPSPPIDNPFWIRYVDRVTTVNGVTTKDTVTAHILDIGSDWTLCTLDNPVTGAGAEVAGLTAPFFYADGEHTFYVEPTLTETSLPSADGWVIPAITANLTYDTDTYWDGLDLHGQVAAAADGAIGTLSPAARFTVTPPADWATATASTISYQGVPVPGKGARS